MGLAHSPRIPTDNLKVYLDISNSKCVDATQTISSSTRLKNLVDTSFEFKSSFTDATSLSNMSFVLDGDTYVYDQVSVSGGDPGWNSVTTINRVENYSNIAWFKYNYGSSYQRSENIYGGGFSGQDSFYLSPAGTSENHGILRYSNDTSPANSNNAIAITGAHGGNDGNWHMFASTDTGGDGNKTTKFYIDGVLKATATSNASHITWTGETGYMTWGSWNTSYGNFGGRTNLYMYYEKVLSGDEIKTIFNATRGRFGI